MEIEIVFGVKSVNEFGFLNSFLIVLADRVNDEIYLWSLDYLAASKVFDLVVDTLEMFQSIFYTVRFINVQDNFLPVDVIGQLSH